MEIEAILQQLEEQLMLINSPLLKLLNSGISKDLVDHQLTSFDFAVSDDFYHIYSWKNGTNRELAKTLGELKLFVGGIFMSLQECVKFYKAKAGTDEYWPLGMFPIFMSGGGEFFLIDLRINSETNGRIYFFCIDDADESDWLMPVFDSLRTCFSTILEWYKSGVLYYNLKDDRILKCNVDLENGTGKKNNPNSKRYWELYKI